MPTSHISILFSNFASDDKILFFDIVFVKFYFRNLISLRKMWPIFFHLNRQILPIFEVILPDQNFTIFLHCYSYSVSDRKNLRVPDFIQIDFCLLFRSAILDPLSWNFELWTVSYDQWSQELLNTEFHPNL